VSGEGIKHEGIIGIRGMRQLISTVSFSVFEAVCWPGMSVSIPFPVRTPADQVIPCATSKRLPRPGFGLPRETFPQRRGSIGDEQKKTCASQELAWR